MKHFVFKTLKLLISQFHFWKILGRGGAGRGGGEGGQVPPRPPPHLRHDIVRKITKQKKTFTKELIQMRYSKYYRILQ